MTNLGREVVTSLLMGPDGDGRLVHDSPVRGDVWASYASDPGTPVDVLMEVYRETPSGLAGARLSRRLHRPDAGPRRARGAPGYDVSYLEGFVAARLTLAELAHAVLPYTSWSRQIRMTTGEADLRTELRALVRGQLDAMRRPEPRARTPLDQRPVVARMAGTARILAALLWAELHARDLPDRIDRSADFLALADIDAIAVLAGDLGETLRAARPDDADDRAENLSTIDASDIFAISRNRPVELAIERSVPAIKADAAGTLFSISCERIGWAVLDTGIDAGHPAFRDLNRPGRSRVASTYDFTLLRRVVLVDYLYDKALLMRRSRDLAKRTGRDIRSVRRDLVALALGAQQQRPIDWAVTAKYIEVAVPDLEPPRSPHGTHVAGILGGCWAEDDFVGGPPTARRGVCPDITLHDFRVVGGGGEDTEFALVGALQFIRHLNSRNNHPRIHGANVSLSIRHDVRNYACGQTPVCEEARRTVDSGVVVVVAAGNRGYQSYNLSDGSAFENYAPSSITDPGNAEAVITVGSTHRSSPHSYGVSFFSSRGPTGDGRQKPDLVAPGEKIWSVVPNRTEDALSGTSMSAPHVSGAAAMLMARNAEFIGRPAEIKSILCSTCTDLGRERSFQGAGMLDILRAMQKV